MAPKYTAGSIGGTLKGKVKVLYYLKNILGV